MLREEKNTALSQNILRTIQGVIGDKKPAIHEPVFLGNEIEYLVDCIKSTYVSSVGSYVAEFERSLECYTGARHAVATVNGTTALQLALLVSGVAPEDEVIVPALTFVATANAVTYLHAYPHFVDSSSKTLGIDPDRLDDWLAFVGEKTPSGLRNKFTGRRISTLLPVHVFGFPCELDSLMRICADYSLTLVEDASESLGSFYAGRHTGTFGRAAAISFNGNKIITTGGGGVLLTNDDELAKRARHLSTTAKLPHKWRYVHDDVGYNFRMPNLNAAVGVAQIERLDNILTSKRELAHRYFSEFSTYRELKMFKEPENTSANYWLNTMILESDYISWQEKILATTCENGIDTRPPWTLLVDLLPYSSCQSAPLNCARYLSAALVNLPSGSNL